MTPTGTSLQVDGVPVLHADDALIVLDKPAGLLSVPGRGEDKQDCLSARVQRVFADALIVHRLDMSTSGLIVMARGIDMQRRLSAAFAEREVVKRYVAVVNGQLPQVPHTDWQTIDAPIAVDWPRRPLRVVDAVNGQASQTRWRAIGSSAEGTANSTRVELEPVTGRTHQLRVHLQFIGHPILGDMLYAPADVQAMAPRLMLHAHCLALPHPLTGETLQLESPMPF